MDVSEIFGSIDARRIFLLPLIGIRAFQIDCAAIKRSELWRLLLHEQNADTSVLQEILDAIRRIVRGDGKICAACFENAEETDDHRERAFDGKADNAAGLDARRSQ